MIKAVIFDIDNTLYSYDEAHAPAFAAVQQYALEHLGMDKDALNAEIKKADPDRQIQLNERKYIK